MRVWLQVYTTRASTASKTQHDRSPSKRISVSHPNVATTPAALPVATSQTRLDRLRSDRRLIASICTMANITKDRAGVRWWDEGVDGGVETYRLAVTPYADSFRRRQTRTTDQSLYPSPSRRLSPPSLNRPVSRQCSSTTSSPRPSGALGFTRLGMKSN